MAAIKVKFPEGTEKTIDVSAMETVTPQPITSDQKRLDVRTLQRHPNQPRYGSERVMDTDVMNWLADTDKENGTIRKAGQDTMRALPVVAFHGGKYTILKGHIRVQIVEWFHKNLPELAEKIFPGHTLLFQVLPIDPLSVEGITLLNDHSVKETPRPLLMAEIYDQDQALRHAMAEKAVPAAEVNKRRWQLFGRNNVNNVIRKLEALPPEVLQNMREMARSKGIDAPPYPMIQLLYEAAQKHAVSLKREEKRKTAYESAKLAGQSEPEALAFADREAKALDFPANQMPAPNPADPGPEYREVWTKYTDPNSKSKGQIPSAPKAMSRAAILKVLDGIARANLDLGVLRPMLDCIIDGKDAELHNAILAVIAAIREADKARTDAANATARADKAEKTAAELTAKLEKTKVHAKK